MADQVESSSPFHGGQGSHDPSNSSLNGGTPGASLPMSIPAAPAGIGIEPDGFPATSLSPPAGRILNAGAAVFVPRVASPMLASAGGPSRGSPVPPQPAQPPHQAMMPMQQSMSPSMAPSMPPFNVPHMGQGLPAPMGYGPPGMGAQGMNDGGGGARGRRGDAERLAADGAADAGANAGPDAAAGPAAAHGKAKGGKQGKEPSVQLAGKELEEVKEKMVRQVRAGAGAGWGRCGLGQVRAGAGAGWGRCALGQVRTGAGARWGRCALGQIPPPARLSPSFSPPRLSLPCSVHPPLTFPLLVRPRLLPLPLVPGHMATGGVLPERPEPSHGQPSHEARASPRPPSAPAPPLRASAAVHQVEFYLSDQNLPTDNHLMKLVRKDPDGYVPLKIIAEFRKIRALVPQGSPNVAVVNLLAAALRASPFLVVGEDGKKVRRAVALGEVDLEEVQARTVVAENLPEDHSIPAMEALFAKAGKVKMVRVCKPEAANSANQAAIAAAAAGAGAGAGGGNSGRHGHKQHAHHHDLVVTNKLHALVEYESVEEAERAVEMLTDENNWRSGLHVRLLIRKPAHKQHQHQHHQHSHQHSHQQHQGQQAHAGKNKKGSQSSLHSNHSSSGSLSAAAGTGAAGGAAAAAKGGGGGGAGGVVDSSAEENLLDGVAASEGLLALDDGENDGDASSTHDASPTAAAAVAVAAGAAGAGGGGGRRGGNMPALSPPGDGVLSMPDSETSSSSPRKGRAIKGRNKGSGSKLSGGSGSSHNQGSSLSRTPGRDGSGSSFGSAHNHHGSNSHHQHHQHSPNNTPPRSRIGSSGSGSGSHHHSHLHPHQHSQHHHHHHLHGGGTPPKGGSLPSSSFLLHGSPLGGAGGGGILGCGSGGSGEGSSLLMRPPPGPRMPDGTKGFAMGRGKRLPAAT
ncbi:unnamed protein product [Closterium sp. NIES-64]|nr:unnamed protein product [Closterium sp. NIES-64]